MPFNIWCGGCNSMIAKGVRFNAEKKQVGNYYSTKIWSFTMKSACCKHEIVIQTDPKNCEYVIISGAQRKTEVFDVEDAETLELPADEGMYILENFAPMSWTNFLTKCESLYNFQSKAWDDSQVSIRSSLAAARADNFYYPPEWDPSQGSLNKFHGQHALRERARKIDQGILIIRGKLADPFYRLEHQEEDLQKKKEAEPVLVRLQRVSDARHSDDYALNKALRAKLRSQKKRVFEEESASRKMGLSIRLLPASEEDGATAAGVKFSSKFERNRKDKRALIKTASIFPGSSGSSSSNKKRLELESKRRKICAAAASNLLTQGFKPSSWSRDAVKKSASLNARKF
ncbi:hypothetical protein GOBAR_AA35962 [Gossypium barbadense]|uniref:Coiled-coil domain-containing protein 130 n=1 Tax=Gossypium barbadense TaxID=3634 RepID=A0A2P5W0Y9_GOSBA|nr:hypothetical protein GOBAR_AA35962 [Gossypium barbadense]